MHLPFCCCCCCGCFQAHARKELGKDVTIFERISDGLQTISKGDIVRISTKPAVLGRVSSSTNARHDIQMLTTLLLFANILLAVVQCVALGCAEIHCCCGVGSKKLLLLRLFTACHLGGALQCPTDRAS
jgi:hypothetical protein